MNIQLETNEGGLVQRCTIPDFKMAPKVLMWGSRIFIFHRWECDASTRERLGLYREAFAYHINHQIERELTEKELVEGTTLTEDDGA